MLLRAGCVLVVADDEVRLLGLEGLADWGQQTTVLLVLAGLAELGIHGARLLPGFQAFEQELCRGDALGQNSLAAVGEIMRRAVQVQKPAIEVVSDSSLIRSIVEVARGVQTVILDQSDVLCFHLAQPGEHLLVDIRQ